MSTRSIIVITGKGNYNQDSTVRLYKHSDGYPTGNLPVIAQALKAAIAQCAEHNEKFGQGSAARKLIVEQVVGLLIGASTWCYGMGANIDACDGDTGVYPMTLKPAHLGNQWDLEWIYVVDLNTESVNVYGGGYANCSPQDHCNNGLVDPLTYAQQLLPDYQARETAEIKAAIEDVESTGFKVNRDSGKSGPTTKRLKPKTESLDVKKNAVVKIVRDNAKGKLRAQHDGRWVRFPNHLRIEGSEYVVETLKPGKSGSWIACGEIEEVAA